MADTQYCEKCHQTMKAVNFYKSNNLEKYPNDGLFTQCKKCMTMQVDNWDPNTFLWILEEADVPYIESEWDQMLKKYAVDPKKTTGTTVLGRYLAKMKLRQWKDYHWADTERLREEQHQALREQMEMGGASEEEIDKALNKKGFSTPRLEGYLTEEQKIYKSNSEENSNSFASESPDLGSDDELIAPDLTEEDMKYLRVKWGKYSPADWVRLETLWNEMMNSFDIQSASHKDYLKLCCKASLKTHQLLDLSDIDGAQKAGKLYDNLMKSGKFTAQQNKESNGEYVDSISALVLLCEKEGFIPTFYDGNPNDKVDQTIQDLQQYTHSLVTEELNLGNLIENALKMLQDEKERENDGFEETYQQGEADFEELNKFLEEELEVDQDFYDEVGDIDGAI